MAKADSTQPGEEDNAAERSRLKARERNRRYSERHRERLREKAREDYRRRKQEGRLPDREKARKWGKRTSARYRQRNREKIREKARQWRIENKDKIRLYCKKYMAKKRKTDRLFALKHDVRTRIRYALSSQSARKMHRTIDLVGCSVSHLASHLESLFRPGMSWDNRGEWHVDHIIPVAKFDLADPEQQAAAFHYTNLQPLWAEENRIKSDRVPGQHLFGFAYAVRIADAASAKPKRRRAHGRQHGGH